MDDFVDQVKHYRRTKIESKKSRISTKTFLRVKILNGANDLCSNSLMENTVADVEYSLNKKQRWNLIENFRTNMGSLNYDDDIRISALEYHTVPGKENLLKAFHTLDDNGGEIHKRTKKGYGTEVSLNGETSKNPKRKKSKRNDPSFATTNENENVPTVSNPKPQIRYEILSQAPRGNKKKKNSQKSNVRASIDDDVEVYSNSHFGSSQDEISDCDQYFDADISAEIRPLNVVDCFTMRNSAKRVKYPSHKSKSVKTNSYFDKPWIRQISIFGEFASKNDAQIDDPLPMTATNSSNFVSNFELIPIDLMCSTDDLRAEFLMESFGDDYIECPCYPRRFLIDFTEDFLRKAVVINQDIMLREVKTFVSIEILADTEVDEGVSSVQVSLNANATKDDGSLSLDSLNPCIIHSVADIVRGAVNSLCSLHLYSFMEPKILQPANLSNSSKVKYPLLKINPAEYVSSKDSLLFLGCTKSIGNEFELCKFGVDTFPKVEEECAICFSDRQGFRLNECGHYFCITCWRDYCMEKIRSNHCPITCPQSKCSIPVDYYLLISFLPLPKCEIYANQMRNMNILRQVGQWYFCPTQNCHLLHFAQPPKISSFHCLCGANWCNECSSAAHWPISCESLKHYLFKLNQNGHDYIPGFDKVEEEKFVKIKKCPTCKQSVEKVEGCDYVTCVCSNAFCWRCLKPWNHGGDHFGCKEAIVEHEEVALVDDGWRKSDNFVKKTLYSRALLHRKANFPPQVRSFKKRIMKRKDSYQFKCGELSTLLKLRNQCHIILEHVFIWIGTECRDKNFGLHIQQISHRLEFYLYLIENIYDETGYMKILALLNEIENLSDNLISKVVLKLNN